MESYTAEAPTREEVDAMPGALVLEFGTSWCGWCRGAQPLIAKALAGRDDVRHIKVEDGPGRALGRSFRRRPSGLLLSVVSPAIVHRSTPVVTCCAHKPSVRNCKNRIWKGGPPQQKGRSMTSPETADAFRHHALTDTA